jgi:hypothetical protein
MVALESAVRHLLGLGQRLSGGVVCAAMAEGRAFSWKGAALVGGIINLAINAPIGWAMVKEGETLGTWSAPGIALDLAITAFAIAFATGFLATPSTRKQVASGKLIPPKLSPYWRNGFQTWPSSIMHRSINLGILSSFIFLPLPFLVLWLFGIDEAGRVAVTCLKGGFAFVVGALVTPIVVLAATVDRP